MSERQKPRAKDFVGAAILSMAIMAGGIGGAVGIAMSSHEDPHKVDIRLAIRSSLQDPKAPTTNLLPHSGEITVACTISGPDVQRSYISHSGEVLISDDTGQYVISKSFKATHLTDIVNTFSCTAELSNGSRTVDQTFYFKP